MLKFYYIYSIYIQNLNIMLETKMPAKFKNKLIFYVI